MHIKITQQWKSTISHKGKIQAPFNFYWLRKYLDNLGLLEALKYSFLRVCSIKFLL